MKNLKEKIIDHKMIVIVICVFLIVGCGVGLYFSFQNEDEGYTTHLTKGNQSVAKNDEIDITKNDIYEYFLDNYGTNQVLVEALSYVADKEITDQDAIDKKVDELKGTYATYANNDLNTYAQSLGYKDEAEFVKDYLTGEAKQELLKDKYIDKQFDKLVKKYKVKYLKIVTVDTESQALKMIKGSKDEKSFQTYFDEFNGSDAGMVTTESNSIDENIIKKLAKFTKDGIYSKAIKTSDSKYAVIWVYNTDKKAVKDEVKASLSNLSDIAIKYETYYLSKYNFDVYEEKIKDKIKEESEDYFG